MNDYLLDNGNGTAKIIPGIVKIYTTGFRKIRCIVGNYQIDIKYDTIDSPKEAINYIIKKLYYNFGININNAKIIVSNSSMIALQLDEYGINL